MSRAIAAAALCALASLCMPCVGAAAAPALDRELVVKELDGETWCTVRGQALSIAELVEDLADRMDLVVVGIDAIPREARADVWLTDRRASEVFAYVLGLVDARAERRSSRLTILRNLTDRTLFGVAPEDGPTTADPVRATREELFELASLAYLRVTRNFPDHPEVPRVLLELARISQALGRPTAARSQYEELINRFPFAEPTRTALYELGQLLMTLGDYGAAAVEFAELLRFERDTSTETSARLQLAHCRAELGQYEEALVILRALDSKTPPRTREERQDRLYGRARFLIGLGRDAEALESLDQADSFGITEGRVRRVALRLRAMAYESADAPDQAARAWLAYQAEVEGGDRADALLRAARAALESGRGEDLLSVVFIAELAAANGTPEATAEALIEARRRLRLAETSRPETAERALELAHELAERGFWEEALQHLELPRERRAELSAEQAFDVLALTARALAESAGIDAAAEHLRREIEHWPDASERKRIYVLAADIYAAHGLWQAEIEALRGRL